MARSVPEELEASGSRLWREVTKAHPELDAGQLVTLRQACRITDACDELAHEVAREGADSKALDRMLAASASVARLLAALRLPDEATGAKPQRRAVRGVQQPSRPGGQPSAKDRLRAV